MSFRNNNSGEDRVTPAPPTPHQVSPLPWCVNEDVSGLITDAVAGVVAGTGDGPRADMDAAYIVRSANAFPVLVEALREVMRVLEDPRSTVSMPHTAKKVREALKLAEGQP